MAEASSGNKDIESENVVKAGTNVSKRQPLLREHETMDLVLSQIPPKVQRGIGLHDENLELTALDANEFYIAIGSSVGIVYLFERTKYSMQRLRAEDTHDVVVSVCLYHGLDDFVAVGYKSGNIYIYQLPSMQIGHSKKLERFTVTDIHQNTVKSLAWSTNGMKLFTGDTGGCVGCTEVDFYEGLCKSSVLLIEKGTEIVQLHHAHRSLIVSTKHRSIIYRMDDRTKLVQIGSKDRKILGDFGGCFIPGMCKVEDAQLYAARPGLRIWKASINGTVSNTYMFKELLAQKHPTIDVLSYEVTRIIRPLTSGQFGQLQLFRDVELVTWNESCVYVVNPDTLTVVGSGKQIGYIKHVSVTGTELFILREGTDRNLVRIAESPLDLPTPWKLKQLQTEREEKQFGSNDSINNIGQKNTMASPFKVFGENLLDKMKHIPKPNVIKDKIQGKLHLDFAKDQQPISKGYVVGDGPEGSSVAEGSKVMSPNDPLPPVIQLTSPNFISVEVAVPHVRQSINKTVTDNITPVLPGIIAQSNEINKDNKTKETEMSDNVNKSNFPSSPPPLTASGPASALARLQMDHQEEESSEPVYVARGPSLDLTQSFTNIDTNTDDDIVFRRKVKSKHRKKKTASRDRESDSLSINSTISANSNSSELSGIVKPTEELSELVNETTALDIDNGSVKEQNNATEKDSKGELAEKSDGKLISSEHKLEDSNQSDEVVKKGFDGSEETVISDLSDKNVIDNDCKDNRGFQNADDGIYDKADISKIEKLTGQNIPDKTKASDNIETDMTNVGAQRIDKTVNEVSVINQSAINQRYLMLNDVIDGRSAKTKLDAELYRLDKFLSDKNETKYSDVTVSSFRKGKVQGLKEHALTEDRDISYKPSRLERELSELEEKSLEEERNKDKGETKGQSESYVPSIYSVYNKPNVQHDDFYSRYMPTSPSELSSLVSDPSLTDIKSELEDNNGAVDLVPRSEFPNFIRAVNSWTEIELQVNVYSLSVSSTHVWATDRSSNIYHSALLGPGLSWKKASGYASQISVSRDGNIVWALYRGTVSAGTKITPKRPEGMKWVEAVKDVAYISVDDTCAWYMKTSGQVMIQKGLSRDRPCFTTIEIDCPQKFKQIVCRAGVVWALTDSCRWLYRSGVTVECPEGKEWKAGDRSETFMLFQIQRVCIPDFFISRSESSGSENRLFSHLALGEDNYGFAMDVVGQIWFCTGVTMDTPRGDNLWWQVPLSGEYFMKDITAMDMLRSISSKLDPQKVTMLLSTQRSGLVAYQNGIWVCPDCKHKIQVCKGNVEGQLWREAYPESLPATSCWKLIDASLSSYENGLVWACQPNGDIFAFTADRQTCVCIEAPKKVNRNVMFTCISVCFDALWGLTDSGEVYIRTGMSSLEPRGSGWSLLDLSQLDRSHLVHISCSRETVWSCDADGNVYHRIGVKAPSDRSLNAAWLPVDGGDTVFTQIASCEQDWKVWALDNRRGVYVRNGITDEMPIGRRWLHVPGTTAMHLSISGNFVWAVNHSGELLCRHGVTRDNVAGDYWKKVPGSLIAISATPSDVLWGISKDGGLVRRYTKYIIKTTDTEGQSSQRKRRDTSVSSEDGDWELV